MKTKDILRLTAAAALAVPLLAACGDDARTTRAPADQPAAQAGDTPPAPLPGSPGATAGGEATPPPTTIDPPTTMPDPEVGVGAQPAGTPPAGTTPADPATPVEEAIKDTETAIEKVPERQR